MKIFWVKWFGGQFVILDNFWMSKFSRIIMILNYYHKYFLWKEKTYRRSVIFWLTQLESDIARQKALELPFGWPSIMHAWICSRLSVRSVALARYNDIYLLIYLEKRFEKTSKTFFVQIFSEKKKISTNYYVIHAMEFFFLSPRMPLKIKAKRNDI